MRVTSKMAACESVQELMSPFIDSMTGPEEAAFLQAHVETCEPCGRQLQSFISVRNLLATVEPSAPPEDLVLDSRIRLSHERTRNDYDRWQNRLNNVLKPLAVPAVMGVTITLFFFGILFGSLVSDPSALAAYDSASDGPIVATYKPISTPDTTIKRFGNTTRANLDQPLSIETNVTVAGLVSDYRIISGTRSAAVDKWLQEMLYFAQFRPATSFGVPVRSKIILSFVDVRL